MGVPQDILDGQALAIDADSIVAGGVDTSEIAANAVTRAKMSTSNIASRYTAKKSITFSGGLKTITTTGFQCSFLQMSPVKAMTGSFPVVTQSTIAGSTVSLKCFAIQPTAATSGLVSVGNSTISFYVVGY